MEKNSDETSQLKTELKVNRMCNGDGSTKERK